MKTTTLLLSLTAALVVAGCDKNAPAPATPTSTPAPAPAAEASAPAPAEPFGKLAVAEVHTLIQSDAAVQVCDANSPATRAEYGVVPGATLLTPNGKDYDVAQLAADKNTKLVFYCSSESCTASHRAAEKALAAGYIDVHIMPAGILGWTEAGLETDKPAN